MPLSTKLTITIALMAFILYPTSSETCQNPDASTVTLLQCTIHHNIMSFVRSMLLSCKHMAYGLLSILRDISNYCYDTIMFIPNAICRFVINVFSWVVEKVVAILKYFLDLVFNFKDLIVSLNDRVRHTLLVKSENAINRHDKISKLEKSVATTISNSREWVKTVSKCWASQTSIISSVFGNSNNDFKKEYLKGLIHNVISDVECLSSDNVESILTGLNLMVTSKKEHITANLVVECVRQNMDFKPYFC